MPSLVDVDRAISEPRGFENVETARTDRLMDRHLTGFVSHLGIYNQ